MHHSAAPSSAHSPNSHAPTHPPTSPPTPAPRLQIYNEQLLDLLNPGGASLALREDIRKGVYVEGLVEETCASGGWRREGTLHLCVCVVWFGCLRETCASDVWRREDAACLCVVVV